MTTNNNSRENPRSRTRAEDRLFQKTSEELSLSNEAGELLRCKEFSIRTEHVMAPELIDYNTESNILSVRLVPDGISMYNVIWNGTTLLNRLRGKAIDRELLLSRMAETGRWLKLYHASSKDHSKAAESLENFHKLFSEKIDLSGSLGILSKNFLNRAKERYLPEIEKAKSDAYQSSNSLSFCRIHSDFIISNQMRDKDWNIYILDFADSRIGTTLEDVGRFYEQLYAIGQTSAFRKEIIDQAVEAFLHAYGLPLDIIERPFFKTVVAYNGLISCITEYTSRPYLKAQFITRMELKRLTQVTLNWMAQELGVDHRP